MCDQYKTEKCKTKSGNISEKFSESNKAKTYGNYLKYTVGNSRYIDPVSEQEENTVKKLDIKFIGGMNIMGNHFTRNLCNFKISVSTESAPHISKASETY